MARRAGVLALVVAGGIGGCSADVFDLNVDLGARSFALDFGQPSGTIPTVTCDEAIAQEVCGSSPSAAVDTSSTTGVPSDVVVALGCDDSTDRCFAQASAHLSQPVNVLQDDAYRHARRTPRADVRAPRRCRVHDSVQHVDVRDPADRYLCRAGRRAARDRSGCCHRGQHATGRRGTVVTDAQHVTISDDTPARPLIEDAIENKQEFVFIVVANPRLEAGAPIPAGAVQIDVFPKLVVGLPR